MRRSTLGRKREYESRTGSADETHSKHFNVGAKDISDQIICGMYPINLKRIRASPGTALRPHPFNVAVGFAPLSPCCFGRWASHLPNSCPVKLSSMAVHSAPGTRLRVIRLALAPIPRPTTSPQIAMATKTPVWNLSFSRRRWVKEDRQHPSTRHDPSISPGDGLVRKPRWRESAPFRRRAAEESSSDRVMYEVLTKQQVVAGMNSDNSRIALSPVTRAEALASE